MVTTQWENVKYVRELTAGFLSVVCLSYKKLPIEQQKWSCKSQQE